MIEMAYKFQINATLCERCESGHVNETYLITDNYGSKYIMQKISTTAFAKPLELMKNVSAVTKHMKKNSKNKVLTLIPSIDGTDWYIDEEGVCWRTYEYIKSKCFQSAETPEIFMESGRAFGEFQSIMSDFPIDELIETIPNFHNTPLRYKNLWNAIENDIAGRAKSVVREIEFAKQYEEYAEVLVNSGLPIRVTHNDAKLSNVLFDIITGEAICVIDLDTVMPGLSVNDFGDSIRFGASTSAEDEVDISKVGISLELFEYYTRGYLSACKGKLTDMEIKYLPYGAKMMTLECGIRFLTDYLNGDIYYRINRERHNLDRCRTQFKLIEDMDRKWDEMHSIIYNNILI